MIRPIHFGNNFKMRKFIMISYVRNGEVTCNCVSLSELRMSRYKSLYKMTNKVLWRKNAETIKAESMLKVDISPLCWFVTAWQIHILFFGIVSYKNQVPLANSRERPSNLWIHCLRWRYTDGICQWRRWNHIRTDYTIRYTTILTNLFAPCTSFS